MAGTKTQTGKTIMDFGVQSLDLTRESYLPVYLRIHISPCCN